MASQSVMLPARCWALHASRLLFFPPLPDICRLLLPQRETQSWEGNNSTTNCPE